MHHDQTRPAPGAAPDLAAVEPRPMDATLGGYPWLPRMADKARASRAGTLGGYVYPCPIDRTLQRLLGIDADAFADIAQTADDDDALLAALDAHGVAAPQDAVFDPVALEHRLLSGVR